MSDQVSVKLEEFESGIEGFLAKCTGKKLPTEQQIACLRFLVGEYFDYHEEHFGQPPILHPIKDRVAFLRMRRRKKRPKLHSATA